MKKSHSVWLASFPKEFKETGWWILLEPRQSLAIKMMALVNVVSQITSTTESLATNRSSHKSAKMHLVLSTGAEGGFDRAVLSLLCSRMGESWSSPGDSFPRSFSGELKLVEFVLLWACNSSSELNLASQISQYVGTFCKWVKTLFYPSSIIRSCRAFLRRCGGKPRISS